jgi:hypothetical protein
MGNWLSAPAVAERWEASASEGAHAHRNACDVDDPSDVGLKRFDTAGFNRFKFSTTKGATNALWNAQEGWYSMTIAYHMAGMAYLVYQPQEMWRSNKHGRKECLKLADCSIIMKNYAGRGPNGELPFRCALLDTAHDFWSTDKKLTLRDGILNETSTDTQMMIFTNELTKAVILSVRGTTGKTDLIENAIGGIRTVKPNLAGCPDEGLVHSGYFDCYNAAAPALEPLFKKLLTGDSPKYTQLFVTGHSLGGGVGSMAAICLKVRLGLPRVNVYTYGAPEIGNGPLCDFYDEQIQSHYRHIQDDDIIPRLCGLLGNGKHYEQIGTVVFLSELGVFVGANKEQVKKLRKQNEENKDESFLQWAKAKMRKLKDSLGDHSMANYLTMMQAFQVTIFNMFSYWSQRDAALTVCVCVFVCLFYYFPLQGELCDQPGRNGEGAKGLGCVYQASE